MTDFFERHRDKIAFAGPDQCWLWTASSRGKGYGQVKARKKTRYPHREAYEAINGEGSADGLVVRHRCDVPLCVNPSHLELGTLADNNRDRDERGRQANGESNGRAKLTESDVRTIRASYVRGRSDHNLTALGRRFGVTAKLVSFIVNRQRWGHVA